MVVFFKINQQKSNRKQKVSRRPIETHEPLVLGFTTTSVLPRPHPEIMDLRREVCERDSQH